MHPHLHYYGITKRKLLFTSTLHFTSPTQKCILLLSPKLHKYNREWERKALPVGGTDTETQRAIQLGSNTTPEESRPSVQCTVCAKLQKPYFCSSITSVSQEKRGKTRQGPVPSTTKTWVLPQVGPRSALAFEAATRCMHETVSVPRPKMPTAEYSGQYCPVLAKIERQLHTALSKPPPLAHDVQRANGSLSSVFPLWLSTSTVRGLQHNWTTQWRCTYTTILSAVVARTKAGNKRAAFDAAGNMHSVAVTWATRHSQ